MTERAPSGPGRGSSGERLGEKLLDLLVFVPAGLAVSMVEELPKLAARGRERLGVPVSSARAVGELAVHFGEKELRRLSGRRSGPPPHRPSARPTSAPGGAAPRVAPDADRAAATVPAPPDGGAAAGSGAPSRGPVPGEADPAPRPPRSNGNVPPASSLAIPAFDTLSASQVVQRLDGLNREELVSVRAYEISTRGRRTILNRVDQLLEERA